MQVHEDKQMQHDTRNGLQRATGYTYSFGTDDLSKAGGIGWGTEISPTLCDGGDVPVIVVWIDAEKRRT